MRTVQVVIMMFFGVSVLGNVLLSEELSGIPFITTIKYKNKDAEKFDLDKEAEKIAEQVLKDGLVLKDGSAITQKQIYSLLELKIGKKYVRIDFAKIDLDKFAEHIRSKKIYDPNLWGPTVEQVQVYNSLLGASSIFDKKLPQFMIDREQTEKDFSSSATLQQAIIKRRSICKAIMTLQNFLEVTIDRDCPKNNPFFVDSIMDHPMEPMDDYRWQIGVSGAGRFTNLELLELKKELTEDAKQELLKFRESLRIAQEKQDKWWIDKAEHTLQQELMDGQKKSLKECHAHLVKLYSLEPRADEELLELFSKSKYPEPEKVKILMELKIPYKNFRYWESQNRRFRTVAQFVSFDKNKNRVTLEKTNGKKTVVRLPILRYADIKYVREQTTSQPSTNEQPKP